MTVTSSLSHEDKVPTTKGKGAERCPLFDERGYLSPESPEGGLWYHTSQGSVWLRQRPADDDQGTFPHILR